MTSQFALRWNSARVLGRRDSIAAFHALGTYGAATVALGVAAWALLADVHALRGSGLFVHENPLGPPLNASVLVYTLFLATSAVVSAARERERGTLEVLFYGPIDELSYVIGKIGGQVAVYLAMLPVILVAFLLFSAVTGFLFSTGTFLILLLSAIPAAQIVAFGLLLAVSTNRVRTAILVFVGLVMLLVGISVAYDLVLLVPISDPSNPILPLRDGLAVADAFAQWVSPLAYADRVVASLLASEWRDATWALAAAIGHAALTIGLTVWALRHRGVDIRRSGRETP